MYDAQKHPTRYFSTLPNVFPSFRNSKVTRKNSRGRSAVLSARPSGRADSYLFIIRSRTKREEEDGPPRAYTRHDATRGRRHRVTYIVMGPLLASKIGCRATTFQTTRGLSPTGRRRLLFRARTKIPRANVRQLHDYFIAQLQATSIARNV